jgi:hypothetical protein
MATVHSTLDTLEAAAVSSVLEDNLGLLVGLLIGVSCLLWCLCR